MSHVALHPHEHEGHLVYTEHGASPYWAWGIVVRDGYNWNAEDVVVEVGGDKWEVDVYFQRGGLDAREDDPVDGRLNEYRIKARPVAPDDRRKFSLKISPRWDGMTSGGDEFDTPFQHDQVYVKGMGDVDMPDEGVDVDYKSSNFATPSKPADMVPAILQALAEQAGEYFDYDYFQDPHPTSSVKAIEGYLRHREDTQDELVQSDGVLMRLFHLLGETEGAVADYRADNQETVGHLHKVKVEKRIDALLPNHQYSKQFKSYHPRDVLESGLLSNPKFGVLVTGGWQDRTVHFHQLEEVWQEIEEAAINVLSWAGIQSGPNGPWVADDHFEPRVSDVEIQRYDDPLPQIEASQEAHVLKLLSNGSNADTDILRELASDGGEQHYTALEEATGYGSSTLYRMLQRLPELVESDNGLISFTSEKLHQDVMDILARTEQQVSRASQQVANMLGIEADVLENSNNAMRQFAQKYAADVNEEQANTLVVKLNAIVSELESVGDEFPKIWTVVKELRRALRGSRYRPQAQTVKVEYERTDGKIVKRPIDSPRLARH